MQIMTAVFNMTVRWTRYNPDFASYINPNNLHWTIYKTAGNHHTIEEEQKKELSMELRVAYMILLHHLSSISQSNTGWEIVKFANLV